MLLENSHNNFVIFINRDRYVLEIKHLLHTIQDYNIFLVLFIFSTLFKFHGQSCSPVQFIFLRLKFQAYPVCNAVFDSFKIWSNGHNYKCSLIKFRVMKFTLSCFIAYVFFSSFFPTKYLDIQLGQTPLKHFPFTFAFRFTSSTLCQNLDQLHIMQ